MQGKILEKFNYLGLLPIKSLVLIFVFIFLIAVIKANKMKTLIIFCNAKLKNGAMNEIV